MGFSDPKNLSTEDRNDSSGWVAWAGRYYEARWIFILCSEPSWKTKTRQFLEWITRTAASKDTRMEPIALLKVRIEFHLKPFLNDIAICQIYTALQSIELESPVLCDQLIEALRSMLSSMPRLDRITLLEESGDSYPLLYDLVVEVSTTTLRGGECACHSLQSLDGKGMKSLGDSGFLRWVPPLRLTFDFLLSPAFHVLSINSQI